MAQVGTSAGSSTGWIGSALVFLLAGSLVIAGCDDSASKGDRPNGSRGSTGAMSDATADAAAGTVDAGSSEPPEDAPEAGEDAGEPAAPTEVDAGLRSVEAIAGCIDRPVAWSVSAWGTRRSYALEPCRDFSYSFSIRRDGPVEASCAHEVPADAETSVDDLDAALADPDVLGALSMGAAALVGCDQGEGDAATLAIEVDGHTFALSAEPCGKSALLFSTLMSITAEQRREGDCAGMQ